MSVTTKRPDPVTEPAAGAAPDGSLTEEERRQRQIELNQPIIALLDSWLEDDQADSAEEQRATLQALMRGIDEHRPPGAKLFTDLLT